MTEEIKIGKKDVVACNYWEACDYYKQLKRLEQERNEWKKKYEDVANENLKEIYELIKKNDCWRGVVNVVCSKLERENKELKEKAPMKLIAKNNAYRSALEEIREIAKDIIENDVYENSDVKAEKILDKINEL